MINVLYIHGFNGSPNGQTASAVKKYFKNHNVIAEQYNLFNYKETIARINKTINENKIHIIIGHSLGGFYTLAIKNPKIFKILINPCMLPTQVLNNLSKQYGTITNVAYNMLFKPYLNKIEQNLDYSNKKIHKKYFAAFSDKDEFPSFKKFFDANIKNKSKSIRLSNARHRLDFAQMDKVLTEALKFHHELKVSKKCLKKV